MNILLEGQFQEGIQNKEGTSYNLREFLSNNCWKFLDLIPYFAVLAQPPTSGSSSVCTIPLTQKRQARQEWAQWRQVWKTMTRKLTLFVSLLRFNIYCVAGMFQNNVLFYSYLFWACQFFVNIAFSSLNRVQSKYEKNLLEKIEVEWRIQLEISFLYCIVCKYEEK